MTFAAGQELPLLRLCAVVAYDGTSYCGFQVQPQVPTIQGELERALACVAHAESRVIGSGRTDTGVHALGQVIAVEVRWAHSPASLQQAWNAHLPGEIAIRNLQPAPAGFHPRFSAAARVYRYSVADYQATDGFPAPQHLPLLERYAWFLPRRLNVAAMQAAAKRLLGEHDFATFGRPPQGENTVRQLLTAEWQVVAPLQPVLSDWGVRRLVFTIRANAFLRRMVRNVVGTLVEVGCGRWSPDDVYRALAAADRSRSGSPAPPQGLVLAAVEYPSTLNLKL